MYAFSRLVLFNGIIEDLFTFYCVKPTSLNAVNKDETVIIRYSIVIAGVKYDNEVPVYEKLLTKSLGDIKICYNSEYPKLNYIQNLNLHLRSSWIGMIVCTFFMLLVTILWPLALRRL